MKLILLSDCHLAWDTPVGRVDVIADAGKAKMQYISDYASVNAIDVVLQAGDLFDVKRSWSLLAMYTGFFTSTKVKFYVVMGQHDSYYHSLVDRTTIFGVLESAGLITRLGIEPLCLCPGVYVYGASYGEPVPKISTKGLNILVIHAPITLQREPWMGSGEIKSAAAFLTDHEFNLILCGDIHRGFFYSNVPTGAIICNTGPLLRMEATEEMMNHTPRFFVYDTDSCTFSYHDIPAAPASRVLTRKHIQSKQHRDDILAKFIDGTINTNTMTHVSFDKNLKAYLSAHTVRNRVKKILSDTYTGKVT